MYTLTVESADPKSISARPKVEFTKSVTKWSLSPSHPFERGKYIVHVGFHKLNDLLLTREICFCRFAEDGVLVEGLFWKDVEALVNNYAKEHKKSK